jgi:NADPH:quinone reductase-like Zn-dependent oxidoreductase
VDHVVVDSGSVVDAVRAIAPAGVGGGVELVGTTTLYDTLRTLAPRATVCVTGVSDEWTVKEFYPIDFIPNSVRLTAYSGEASDLSPEVLQGFLDAVSAGDAVVPVGKVYRLDKIAQAHADMENGNATGKLVVLTEP